MMRIKRLWQRDLEASGLPLYVWPDRIACSQKRNRTSVITAFQENGKLAWERELGVHGVGYFFPAGRTLYVDGALARKVDVQTGEILVEREFGGDVRLYRPGSQVVVAWFGQPASLVGLSLDTLEKRWEWPDPDGAYGVHDGFLCRYEKSGNMWLVDLSTFREGSQTQGPSREEYGRGHAHLGDIRGEFYDRERVGIDQRTGAVVWRREEQDYGFHHTIVFNGDKGYSGDRGLSAYDLKTGGVIWRQDMGWLSSSPHVEDERIYVGSKDGVFHVVNAATGQVLLSHAVDFEPVVVKPMGADRIVVGGFEEVACYQILP